MYISNDLSCQAEHAGDTSFEFYPPDATAADCATFLATGGRLYSPDFSAHSGTATGNLNGGDSSTITTYTEVSQTPVTGSGTSASPYSVTTVVTLGGTPLTISQTDTYVVGNEYYDTSIVVANSGTSTVTGTLFHAGDCYLQNSDTGYGATGPTAGEVLCTENPQNSPSGRILGFIPMTPGSHYTETQYSTMWGQITAAGTQFPGTCACNIDEDNAAGLSWPISVPAAGSTTGGVESIFSPTGGASPTPTPTPTPTATPTSAPVPATGAAASGNASIGAGIGLLGVALVGGSISLIGRRRRR